MRRVVVAEKGSIWEVLAEQAELITPQEYLGEETYQGSRRVKVINLCRSYQYQGLGYYISLMAEARGHRVLPDTSTMIDFRHQNIIRDDTGSFTELLQQGFAAENENKIELTILFGMTTDVRFSKIGLLLFNLYQVPLLRASFVKKDKWTLQNLKPVSDKDLNEAERAFAVNTLNSFLSGKRISGSSYKRKKFDLAILVSQEDPTPPSDPKAIQKFIKAAEHVGFNVDLITRAEYGKITQYDALFIRETTNVNHHTYRFARKAQLEGLAVIDDPDSILRCTNKVYLNELLTANRISVPRTIVIRKDQKKLSNLQINFPAVIKVPDGSFSKGVKKVNSLVDLQKETKEFFKNTDLLIVQEFMPTDFDWRVGVVNGKVLYVCKYFMARNHWQIVDWGDGKYSRLGKSETISIDSAPHGLIKLALKAASLIGKGLYGLDIKEVKGRFFVIEINDNPSIESGVEDKVEKMNLYENIMSHLLTQVQNK